MNIFFAHGTQLVWLVYPKQKLIRVYKPIPGSEKPDIKTFTAKDMIDAGDVLPGFSVLVESLFPEQAKDEST